MIKKIIIALIVLLSLSVYQSVAQSTDRFVKVGDTTVNLRDVDLEKGLVIKKHISQTDEGESIEYEKKLFKCPDNLYYMVVNDSSFYSGYTGVYETQFSYHRADGTELFSKSFNDLGVSNVSISKEGKGLFIKLGSENEIKFLLLNADGKLLKEIKNNEVYLTPDNDHTTFYLQEAGKKNKLQLLNIDTGIEKLLVFKTRVYLRNISPSGNYFTSRSGDSLLVYDRYGNYQWGIKHEKQNIYIFSNGKRYYIKHPFPIGKLEVKDAADHSLLYSINRVYYNGKDYPVYKSGVVNNTEVIWVSYYVGSIQAFNFIDNNGNIVNIDTVPSNIGTNQITFTENNNHFKAIY